jgi:aminocarboxymuconate-semialdehyde decarboxylase
VHVDVHAHVLPPSWPDLAEKYGDVRWPRLEHVDSCSARILADGKVFREIHNGCYDLTRRLEDMRAGGTDRQVLSTVPVMFSYWADPLRTLELARHLNDHIAGLVQDDPEHFSGFGTVPLNDVELAVAELERCLEDGLVGVEIGTNIDGLDLDDARFLPFFQAAAELGALVFVHPWNVIGAARLPPSYYTLYTVAMPSETAFAFAALALGGVFERVPDLRVLFAHGGGSIPFIVPRMERGRSIWPPAQELAPRPLTDYLERCYFDSLTWDSLSLELLVCRVGAEHVLLGSDYPFLMGEDKPGTLVEQSSLSSEDKELILGGNCHRLLGVNAAQTSPVPSAG